MDEAGGCLQVLDMREDQLEVLYAEAAPIAIAEE